MTAVLEFWYEFASTYSYPAAMRAEHVAAQRGLKIAWKPFLLGPIFADLGWSTSPFNLQPAKGAYMWRDMERICAQLNLRFEKPNPFPQNGLLAARVAIALPDTGPRAAFSRAIYDQQFAQARNIAATDVVTACLKKLDLNVPEILERAQSRDNKTALRTQTEQAQSHGIFGAPTWRTPDGELFWGNDRLEDALEWVLAEQTN